MMCNMIFKRIKYGVVIIAVVYLANAFSFAQATATLSVSEARSRNQDKVQDKSTLQTQEDSLSRRDSSLYLSEVNVLATRVRIAWHEQARMITSVNKPVIQNSPAQSINDILKYSASVDVRQRGPIGAQTDVSIRGGNSEQAAILLNGVNISDPQTAHNSFDLPISVLQVEGIEILGGPAGKITGASSLLGAVNVRTHIADYNRLLFNIEGGSYGYLATGVKYDLASLKKNGVPALKNSLSASYTRSDGYSRGANERLNMDYKTAKAFYEGRYTDDDVDVSWFAGLSNKDFGSNKFYASSDEQFEHTFKTFSAIKARNLKGKLTISPTLYWNYSADRFELFRNRPEAYPFNYHKTNVYGANLNNYFRWIGGITAFGGEIRNEDLISGNLGDPLSKPKRIKGTDRFYEYGLNRTNTSFYIEHNIIQDRFSLSAALLAIKNSWAEMKMKVYPSIDASVAIYKHSDKMLHLFASYNSSLRMPSITELYYSVGGHKADKHLKPEEVAAVEVGLRYSSTMLTASASYYHNKMTNLIDWIRNTADGDAGIWRSVNFGKINADGILLQASVNPGLNLSYFDIENIGISYSHISQSKADDPGIQSKYTLEYLKHKFVATAHIAVLPSVKLSVFYRFQDRTGSYTSSDGTIKNYKPYGIIDARLAYLWKNFSFYFEGNNLCGVKYTDYGAVAQPGVWCMAGVKYTLF